MISTAFGNYHIAPEFEALPIQIYCYPYHIAPELEALPIQIYCYPTIDRQTGSLITANNLRVDTAVQSLYDYILQRGTIVSLTSYNEELLAQGIPSDKICIDSYLVCTAVSRSLY